MRSQFIALLFAVLAFLPATWATGAGTGSAEATTESSARTTISRQGEFALKQLVTPHFERLPLERRIFAYYLSRAIDMGRDIAWAQGSKEGLTIRALLEDMWTDSRYFSPRQKAALLEYFFKVLANHSNYDHNSNQKFLPEGISQEEFMNLAALADSSAVNRGSTTDATAIARRAQTLAAAMFDLNHYPYQRASEGDLDPIADSAADYYGPGVNSRNFHALSEADQDNFLSYPVHNANGTIDPSMQSIWDRFNVGIRLHRIGDRFDEELRLIDFFLSKASLFGNDAEKTIIAAHRKAMASGNPQDVIDAETLWVQYKPQDFDFVLGFVETYGDPRNTRGSWEGFLLMINQDPVTLARISAIRRNADYFEANMPVDERFKKEPGFTPPQAEGAYIIYSGGDNGERPFAGVNLPNYREIHERFGSKSFTALNVMHEIGAAPADTTITIQNFYQSQYHQDLLAVNSRLLDDIQVEFHEILGHGSGKNLADVSETALKSYYNPLEEGRAETASLFHILDPKLVEFGILPSTYSAEDAARAARMMILDFFTSQIHSYAKLSDTTTGIRQAHQWARQVMLNRLIHAGGLRVELTDQGLPQVVLGEMNVIRQTFGQIWAELQEAKSTGNIEMAKNIFDTWGAYTDQHREWRKAVVELRNKLRIPKEHAFLNPVFAVTRDISGDIADVQLTYEQANAPQGLELFIERQARLTRARQEAMAECQSSLNPKKP